ncbi:MAG: aminotransferase class I/II-fold pyridoxal phosphate-dependent enzyme [Pseudomonadota bacterium]
MVQTTPETVSTAVARPRRRGETASLTRRIDAAQGAIAALRTPCSAIEGEEIDLSCTDYLRLRGHAAIADAAIGELKGDCGNIYMSAAFLTDSTMQRAVERKFAAFLSAEDAVLCQSGWCANVGLMQAVTDEKTHVYLDEHVHAGVWDGATSAGAIVHAVRHNDPSDLERLLKTHGPGVVVVSSVYPGDGSIAPLASLARLAKSEGCEMAVDETHSIGVFGRHGEGLVSALGLADRVNYRLFSLSKAMGTRAGMVAGPARIVDFFRYESRPAIFSSAVLQYEIAGLAAALDVVQEEDWRRDRLRGNTKALRAGLRVAGFGIDADGSQLMPVFNGSLAEAEALRAELAQRQLKTSVIAPSPNAPNSAYVRLAANSAISTDEIHRVVAICGDVLSKRSAAS